jgi:ribosomal-protein-alanine N-acetyltransferase
MTNKNKTDPPLLTTARLQLRSIGKSDSDDLYAIYSDMKTLEYWGQDPVQSPADAWKKIRANMQQVEGGSAILWGIALRDNNRLIGTCTIFRINQQNKNGEAGYILNRKHWGKGLMTEAMSSVLDYAFNDLEFHRLEADTDPENAASLALLEKLGFQREGYFRERWFVHGKWHDSVMLGLLRSEYFAKVSNS